MQQKNLLLQSCSNCEGKLFFYIYDQHFPNFLYRISREEIKMFSLSLMKKTKAYMLFLCDGWHTFSFSELFNKIGWNVSKKLFPLPFLKYAHIRPCLIVALRCLVGHVWLISHSITMSVLLFRKTTRGQPCNNYEAMPCFLLLLVYTNRTSLH